MSIAHQQENAYNVKSAAKASARTFGMHTDLSRFDKGEYRAGPKWKIVVWYVLQNYIFDSAVPFPYGFKRWLLRIFGARVGKGVVIKPHVRIKYPWRLTIGNHSWIGESVWIDNLVDVEIGHNVALSQGAHLLTGNHDYTNPTFPYRLGKVVIEDGVWVGAHAIVCPDVICQSHAVLTVNSVATKSLEPWSIYSGNPAVRVRSRSFSHAR